MILESVPEKREQPLHFIDIGTGSGCIAIAVKKHRPEWLCTGIDISEKALETAASNSRLNETDVRFIRCDLNEIESNPGIQNQNWDIVVSNPPYITPIEKKTLDPQVEKFEPGLALFHDHPLHLYKKISAFASEKKSLLFLECNNRFIEDIKEVAGQFFSSVEVHLDYDGNRRFIVGKKSSN